MVRFAVHVAEFFILLSSLGGVATFTVMVLRAGSLLVAGGWWGLLEIMRERLRGFARTGQRERAETEIGSWFFLSVILAVTVTLSGGVALLVARAGDDPLGRLYAFLVIVELAIGLPVRVLHSGIYATRRVYKPIASMFAPTVAQLAVLGVGFFYYPTAAIIASIVVSNALSIWITVHYSLEVYRLMGLRPRGGQAVQRRWPHLPKFPPLLGFQAALSGMSLRLDAVLVLALVGFYGTDTRSFDLTAASAAWRHVDAFQFFYLVLPLFRGTYESAAIFYFDLVRLRSTPVLRQLQLTFFRRLLWVAPVIALFYWSLAAVLGVFVLHDVPVSFLLALIPLFIVRSFIGIYQIRLFADGRFGTHIASLVSLVVLLSLVWMEPNPASDLIQITAVMITQLIILIDVQHLRDRRDPPAPVVLPLAEWVRELSGERGPVRTGRLSIGAGVTGKQRSAAIQLATESLAGQGHLGFRSPTAALFYQRCDSQRGDDQRGEHQRGPDGQAREELSLTALTGGAVSASAAAGAAAEDGRSALQHLAAAQWLPQRAAGALPEAPDGTPDAPDDHPENSERAHGVTSSDGYTDDPDALAGPFRALFTDGIVFDAVTLAGGRDLRGLDEDLLTAALPAAVTSLETGVDMVSVSGRWITPVYRRGELRQLLVLPPDPDKEAVGAWLRTVRHGSADSAGSERAERVTGE